MADFVPVYVPVGVPTFHLETAKDVFEKSGKLLLSLDPSFVCPKEMLLGTDALSDFLAPLEPDLIVFQNLTFANGAYMMEVLRRFDCPLLLWTPKEPAADGGRLKLNALTGAFSAANAVRAFKNRPFTYVFGAPDDEKTAEEIGAFVNKARLGGKKRAAGAPAGEAARVREAMKSLKIASVGHSPQGFGFGRALDAELMSVFGAELVSVEARELMEKASGFSDEECAEYLERSRLVTRGLENVPEKNRLGHARLYRAYAEFVRDNGIGALASRCWPDFFTAYGTPVCAVLSLLNDDGVASACETDVYGALSMWIGAGLSGFPAFFGDPVALNEGENSLTFWHCGAAAPSLARKDTGALIGLHPNRRMGPVMDFGCEAFPGATVFRVGREPDGSFRFFIMEGEMLEKPKQYTGTSVVVRTDSPCREAVGRAVREGFEPHFAVIRGRFGAELEDLARLLGVKACRY